MTLQDKIQQFSTAPEFKICFCDKVKGLHVQLEIKN